MRQSYRPVIGGSWGYFSKALLISILVHVLVIGLFSNGFFSRWRRPVRQVTYSISLESGHALGGVSQVPKQKQVAPPPARPKATPTPVVKQVKQPKTTPKPTPKPVVKKVATPKPTVKPSVKQVAKKVNKPTPTPPPTVQDQYQQALEQYLGESTDAGGQGFGSTARGGSAMGGGQVRSPEWFLYKDQLESYIKRGWNWHDVEADLITTVSFRISATGEISDVRLVQTSGNRLYDDSVQRAVWKASPVPPAPPHLFRDFSYVEMDFRPH